MCVSNLLSLQLPDKNIVLCLFEPHWTNTTVYNRDLPWKVSSVCPLPYRSISSFWLVNFPHNYPEPLYMRKIRLEKFWTLTWSTCKIWELLINSAQMKYNCCWVFPRSWTVTQNTPVGLRGEGFVSPFGEIDFGYT